MTAILRGLHDTARSLARAPRADDAAQTSAIGSGLRAASIV